MKTKRRLGKTTEERFWEKVDKSGECWEWTAGTVTGYGQFVAVTAPRSSRRSVVAHRFAYELLVGPIPEELHLDHLCRNRKCVNPEHLEPVALAENNRRAGAAKEACLPRGHAYTPENTYVNKEGRRSCQACRDERNERRRRGRRSPGIDLGPKASDFLRASFDFHHDLEPGDLSIRQILQIEEMFDVFIPASVLV